MERENFIAPKIWFMKAWCPKAGNYVLGAKQVAQKMPQEGKRKEEEKSHLEDLPPLTLDIYSRLSPQLATLMSDSRPEARLPLS